MGCSFVNGNCCGHDEQMITKQSKAFVRRSRGNRSRKKLMTKFSRKMCVWAGSRRRRQKRESAKSGNKDVALLTPIPLIFIKTSPREQEKNINQLILHQTLLASGLYFGDIGSPSWKTFTKASGAERHRDSDSNNFPIDIISKWHWSSHTVWYRIRKINKLFQACNCKVKFFELAKSEKVSQLK